jgi:hypothetical protein
VDLFPSIKCMAVLNCAVDNIVLYFQDSFACVF